MSSTTIRTESSSAPQTGNGSSGTHSAEQVKEAAAAAQSAVSQRSQELLTELGAQAREESNRQKQRAAEGIRQVGGQLRGVSQGDAEPVTPMAREVVGIAADRVDQLAGYVERSDPRGWWTGVQSFARREPAAFAVAGVATGLVLERVVRAMRASAASSREAEWRGSSRPMMPAGRPTQAAQIDMTTGVAVDDPLVGASVSGPGDELVGGVGERDVHVTSRYNPTPPAP